MYEIDVIRSIKGLIDKGFAKIRMAETEKPEPAKASAEELRNTLRDMDADAAIEGSPERAMVTQDAERRDSES